MARSASKVMKATRICTGMSIAAGAVLFLACSLLFPMISPEFSAAAPILLILTIGYVVQAASGFPMPLIVGFGLERNAVLPGLAVALLGVGLMVLLTSAYGAVGAAIGTSLAVSATAIVRCLIVYENAKVRCDIFSAPLTEQVRETGV